MEEVDGNAGSVSAHGAHVCTVNKRHAQEVPKNRCGGVRMNGWSQPGMIGGVEREDLADRWLRGGRCGLRLGDASTKPSGSTLNVGWTGFKPAIVSSGLEARSGVRDEKEESECLVISL